MKLEEIISKHKVSKEGLKGAIDDIQGMQLEFNQSDAQEASGNRVVYFLEEIIKAIK